MDVWARLIFFSDCRQAQWARGVVEEFGVLDVDAVQLVAEFAGVVVAPVG
jgi:hypothetical protein